MLNVAVKSTGGRKHVEGTSYAEVMEMEGIMRFIVNGNVIKAGTKYQWYYARRTGLILTTSKMGDNMPLINCSI